MGSRLSRSNQLYSKGIPKKIFFKVNYQNPKKETNLNSFSSYGRQSPF